MPPRATTRRGAGAPVDSERGVVEATNEKGVKLNGRWLNYSQFHDVPHPEPGDEIEVEIARDRFINALNIVGGAERPAGSGGDMPLDLEDLPEDATPFDAEAFEGPSIAGGAPAPTPAPAGQTGQATRTWGTARAPDRNTEIRRLALIKAAADFHAGRADSSEADVLAAARQWEQWVVEPPSATDEERQRA